MSFIRKFADFFRRESNDSTQSEQHWREGYGAFKRGQTLYLENDYQRALSDFDIAVGSGFENADLFGMRGSCLQSLDFHLDAIEELNKAIHLDPADSNSYFMRSVSKGGVGDLQGRIEDLNEAIRLAGVDSPSSRVLNANARQHGFADGIAGMYQMQIIDANLDIERQALEERRPKELAARLGPDLVTKRQSRALTRRRIRS